MAPLLLSLLLIFQGVRIQRLSENPVDDTYSVVLMRDSSRDSVIERVVLQARNDRSRYWNLETFDTFEHHYEILRADRNSVVLFRSDDYGFGDYVKLFFDSGSKRVVKRIEFKETSFSQIPTAETLRILGITGEFPGELNSTPVAATPLPEGLLPGFPQSTYDEFARARPERVRNGYTSKATHINEQVQAYAIVGNRVWFGKSFYDGEGLTGVGGIGYFDRTTNKYTFLRIPEVVGLSVSGLLVENEFLWAALVGHPEGADYSGGLLRYDLKTGTTKKYPVTDVISRVIRWRDDLYVSTSNGIYTLKDDQLRRYRVEPDINGKPTVYSDRLQ
jgi:hypothetical protein